MELYQQWHVVLQWTQEGSALPRRTALTMPFLPVSSGPLDAITKAASLINVDLSRCDDVKASKSGLPCAKPGEAP